MIFRHKQFPFSLLLVLANIFGVDSEIGAPIVLIPGDGGTQIDAKLNKSETVHYLCEKKTSDFFTLWLNLELLLPYVLDCFVDNMKLIYNETTHTTHDTPGVTTRIFDFGNTSTVEYLDPSKTRVGIYYAAIVEEAVKWGYRRGKSIRGAPFDFRKAPNEMTEYFQDLKALIEETYYSNGNKKVVTIGHSMGNPVALYFFNRQAQSWKNKFIKSHISVSAPWGGSFQILKLFASGYNMNHYRIVLPPSTVRPMQRSFTSSAFLMPSDKFWPPNETLVITPKKNYTSADYEQFFKDINFDLGWTMYKEVGRLTYDLTPPEVEVHCLYGTNLPTPIQLEYAKGYFPDYQPTDINGDGDGTVPIRSLKGCLRWRGHQDQKVLNKGFPGKEHLDVLQDPNLISYVKDVLYDQDKTTDVFARLKQKKKPSTENLLEF